MFEVCATNCNGNKWAAGLCRPTLFKKKKEISCRDGRLCYDVHVLVTKRFGLTLSLRDAAADI